jgi:hypothetical protein
VFIAAHYNAFIEGEAGVDGRLLGRELVPRSAASIPRNGWLSRPPPSVTGIPQTKRSQRQTRKHH